MKKHFLLILLVILSAISFCQNKEPKQTFSSSELLKKSKNQQKTAWILLGAGVISTVTGFTIGMNDAVDFWENLGSGEAQPVTSKSGEIFFFTGLVAMAASVPLFIISSSNKRKAKHINLSFKMNKFNEMHQLSLVKMSYPALSFKMNL